MRLSNIYMTGLAGDRPRLEYEKPTLKDGKWLVSGKMIVEFKPDPTKISHHGKGLVIEVLFVDATDEDDAVRQASMHLQKIGVEISQVASSLLKEPKQNP